MIKNGKYAWYRGNEFELSEDDKDNIIIVTEDKMIVDDTFEDRYHTGVYSKTVDLSELDEIYLVTTYAIIDEHKITIIKEYKEGYIIGTNNSELAELLHLERVDKYGYEGWVSANVVQIVEEKHSI